MQSTQTNNKDTNTTQDKEDVLFIPHTKQMACANKGAGQQTPMLRLSHDEGINLLNGVIKIITQKAFILFRNHNFKLYKQDRQTILGRYTFLREKVWLFIPMQGKFMIIVTPCNNMMPHLKGCAAAVLTRQSCARVRKSTDFPLHCLQHCVTRVRVEFAGSYL